MANLDLDLEQKSQTYTHETTVSDKLDALPNAVVTFEKQPRLQAIKENPVAILSCMYMLFTCIMWGYDGMAGGIVLAMPQWRESYGYLFEGQYVVEAKWQLTFNAATLIGLVCGGLATGYASKIIGQKPCIAVAHLTTIGGVFAQWYSPGKPAIFFVGKLFTGLPMGCYLTTAPTYCGEVAPPALRGAMVAAVNFCLATGQLIGYGVMREAQVYQGDISFRIMYAVQWGFAAVGLIALPFVPESPFRLLGMNKEERARKSIRRLYGASRVDEKVQQIKAIFEANEAEQSGSFRDCFNSANRLRTFLAVGINVITNMAGIVWVVGYMGYFLQLSGIEGQKVFDISVAIAGIMCIGNMCSWVIIERLGRRWAILAGLFTCTTCLLLIGVLTQFIHRSNSIVLAQVSFMAIWAFAYQSSLGSAAYVVMAELPTSSLRAVTQSMATAVNGGLNTMWSFIIPYMVNPDEANMGGNVAFVFFGLLVICTSVAFFYYPETKGRSFEEIDLLFSKKVNLRHWSGHKL